MSQTDSPSITQYFKAQRKRARVGKEGDLVTNKKLLLEDGSARRGSVEEPEEDLKKPIPELVVVQQPKSDVEKRTKKKATGVKKSVKSKAAGSAKISMFAKPITPSTEVSKEKVLEEKPGPSKAPEEEEVKKPEEPSELVQPLSSGNVEKEVSSGNNDKPDEQAPTPAAPPKPVNAEGSVEGVNPSKSVMSPVKFTKVGALSPLNKNKMTKEELKRILKKKTTLKELKKSLAGINNCAQKLDEFRRTVAEANTRSPVASPAKATTSAGSAPVAASPRASASTGLASASKKNTALDKVISPAQFYSPSSADRIRQDLERLSATKRSPSKLALINNRAKKRLFDEQQAKEGDKKVEVPAYQRFHSLAQKSPAERGSGEEIDLPLPYHFRVLKELFVAVETVLGIMKSRKEIMIFPKVQRGVQELFKRVNLREKHLAQMVTILPGCYSFGLEKVGRDTHIRIDVEDLPPSVVCERRKRFLAAMTKICLEHHQKFLLGLTPPIVVPAGKQITRWHPLFKIDELPDVIPLENVLPVKPAPEKISSAREVIAKAQNILENANPRMKQAVKNMLNKKADEEKKKEEEEKEAQPVSRPTAKQTAAAKALKGVSSSLLEKIRNREREKLLHEMTRSPAESKKLQMTKRMPEFIKIIRNMMVADKKVALPIGTVIERVCNSVQKMTTVDAESHIRLLTTLLPHWIKIHKLSHSITEYVKIEKNADINVLLTEMDDIIKKFSS